MLNASAGGTAVASVGSSGSYPWMRCSEIQPQHRDEAEREQREGVDGPGLLARRIDAADAIDDALDRREDPVSERLAAAEHGGDVGAEHASRDQQDGDQ